MFIGSEPFEEQYLSLKQLYEQTLKEKQEAFEEHERLTVSFAVHFDREVTVLGEQIETLTKERDKATTEVEDLEIKLENTKYELNRLQREHIKLQLDQEKCLDKIEELAKLQKVEDKLEEKVMEPEDKMESNHEIQVCLKQV